MPESQPCPAVQFGWWCAHDGRKYLLEWRASGHLLLDGDEVCFIASEADVRRRLEGWEYHCDQRNAIAWLAARLGGEP